MKKIICILSLLLVITAVGTACGKEKPIRPVPAEYTGETVTTTEAQYTVGTETSSTKVDISKKEYEINYVDGNGNAVKTEHYKKKKLIYYYVYSAADENGNGIQEKYYDPDGNLIGTAGDGYFYDKDGKQITEEMMSYLLYQYE